MKMSKTLLVENEGMFKEDVTQIIRIHWITTKNKKNKKIPAHLKTKQVDIKIVYCLTEEVENFLL